MFSDTKDPRITELVQRLSALIEDPSRILSADDWGKLKIIRKEIHSLRQTPDITLSESDEVDLEWLRVMSNKEASVHVERNYAWMETT